MKPILLFSCLVLSILISAQPGESSNVPRVINYQGRLTDNLGGQVADGNYTMTFTIYDALTNGNSLWTSGQQTVKVSQGLFTYLLGSSSALSSTLFSADSARYLGITVGNDPEISPRTKITSVGYAFQALKADSALNAVNAQQSINSDTADYAFSGAGNWTVSDSVLFSNYFWGLARGNADNLFLGDYAYTMTNFGVACTTGQSTPYDSYYDAVLSGYGNVARGNSAVVGGGSHNKALETYAAVCGGGANVASGLGSFIGGGLFNDATISYAAIAGGIRNMASGNASFIGAGGDDTAAGYNCSIIGAAQGINNGDFSTLLGGENDTITANADYALVYGKRVKVDTPYRVVFFDAVDHGRFGLNRDDSNGGIGFPIHVGTNINNGSGAYLTTAGVWTSTSSREFKENLASIDRNGLFESISRLGLFSYNYKGSDEQHIGPMAEDFVAEFNVGVMREDGTRENQYLAAGDVAGVALMGVKELISENQELRQMIEELKKEIAAIKAGK